MVSGTYFKKLIGTEDIWDVRNSRWLQYLTLFAVTKTDNSLDAQTTCSAVVPSFFLVPDFPAQEFSYL